MGYHMIRPIPDDAVKAITANRMLWQFSQCNYSAVFTAGSFGMTVEVPPATVTISNFPYAAPACDFILTASNNEIFDSMMVSLDSVHSILQRMQFETLHREWIKTRRASSIAGDVTRNAAYFKIVGMGPSALPYIFEHLREETRRGMPDHWFAALWSITGGENPVPEEEQGRTRKMAEAWLAWGERRGYLNAKGLGSVLSQSQR